MVAAPPPPPPPAIVRAWSKALNANDNVAAAALFAPRARVIQPGVDVWVNPPLALLFHQSLPCGGTILQLSQKGKRVTATFVLKQRPRHRCDAPGHKAAAVFTIEDGKIVRWEQVAVPDAPPA